MAKVKQEPTVQFAIGAMCGCNLAEAKLLADQLLEKEKEDVLSAYKGGKGRQVLTKIRSRIEMEKKAEKAEKPKVPPPVTTDK